MALFCMSQGAGLLSRVHPDPGGPSGIAPLIDTMIRMLQGEHADAQNLTVQETSGS